MCALVGFRDPVEIGVRDCLQHQEGERADGVEISLVGEVHLCGAVTRDVGVKCGP